MPVVLVSIADVSRLWLKSRVGLPVTEINRDFAFCNYTIRNDAPPVFIVLDADKDPRFFDKPFVVGPPFAKFYAGAPVICDGIKLGSFCVLDGQPHDDFDEEKQNALIHFASLASDLISQHKQATFVSKFDPSLLSLAILQVLRDPLRNALTWRSELDKTFQELKTADRLHVQSCAQSLSSTFDAFRSNSIILQQSLELTLRFASSVAHQHPNASTKRKIGMEYSPGGFVKEIQRISGLDGYKEITWTFNDETIRNFSIECDPTTLAAVCGFLSLKNLNMYSSQNCYVNFIPTDRSANEMNVDVASNSFDSDAGSNNWSCGGIVHVHCRFLKPVGFPEEKDHPNQVYVHDSQLSRYDIQLINEILFGLCGSFEVLHLKENGDTREFRLCVPVRYNHHSRRSIVSSASTAETASLSASPSHDMKMVVTSGSDSESTVDVSSPKLGLSVKRTEESPRASKRIATSSSPTSSEKIISPRLNPLELLVSIVTSRPPSAKVHP